MSDIALLLQKLNVSLGFHIPDAKVKHLEEIASQAPDQLVEAILYIEGLDYEDDVRPALQSAVSECLLAGLHRKIEHANRLRETLTLKRKSPTT